MSKFESLFVALEKDGWSITSEELASDCWWAREIWKLRSNWSPRSAVVYVTLLVDPTSEHDRNNVPDAAIWAVGLSRLIPDDRMSSFIYNIPTKNQFRSAKLEIGKLVATLRVLENGEGAD